MTKRFYSGVRDGSTKMGEAAKLKRLEIELGGKLPITRQERYKKIMEKKFEEHRKQAMSAKQTFQLPGTKAPEQKMSKTTQEALEYLAKKKAAKEEKALRQMVIVQPRVFSDAGRIDSKGNAYDLGNNLTLKVDTKTGKIKTRTGWTVGKYSTKKKFRSNMILTDALKKHGAYFIQQKRLQMLQEQQRLAELGMQDANVYGAPMGGGLASQAFLDQHYGSNTDAHGNTTDPMQGQRVMAANVGAWGAISNNAHGTFIDNAWGGMMDNVWGGTNNNIWGGLGGSGWGSHSSGWGSHSSGWGGHRGWKIFGSGTPGQKNYLKPLGALFAGLLGFKGKRLGMPLRGKAKARSAGRSR